LGLSTKPRFLNHKDINMTTSTIAKTNVAPDAKSPRLYALAIIALKLGFIPVGMRLAHLLAVELDDPLRSSFWELAIK
jgi:hypothetical protein